MDLSDKLNDIAKTVQQLGKIDLGSSLWKCLFLLIVSVLLIHAVKEPMEKHFHSEIEVNIPSNGVRITTAISIATTAAMPIRTVS